eukprot:jgi/Mesen1/7003/ME000365S06141
MAQVVSTMEDRIKAAQIEARAQAISSNVRCLECGHQSIEDSQADIAILLRRVIRQELKKGKHEKEIFAQLKEDYGDSVLYAPPFDAQTATLWLLPVICLGAAAGISLYRKAPVSSEVLTRSLLQGFPVTPAERAALQRLLSPPQKKPGW